MSDHLSDNMSEWPEDPYKILNVDSNDDKKTVKRAYNKLIRKFKPDHFPEEFRIIREAYEAIQNRMEYSGFFTFEDELFEDPEEDTLIDEPVVESEAHSLWLKAIDGNLTEAFTGLKKLALINYENEAVLKLYWLRRICPGLPELDILKILTESYLKDRDYRISTLIFREMEYSVGWTLGPGCMEFVDRLSDQNSDNIRMVLEKRWKVAYEHEKCHLVCEDLEHIRPRFILKEEEWGLILLQAHNFISFQDFEGIEESLAKYHKEVSDLPVNVGGYLDSAMDTYDYLREVRKIIRDDISTISANWEKIISAHWAGSERIYKSLLEKELLRWINYPDGSLREFEGINVKVYPIFMSQLKKVVQSYAFQKNSEIYISDEELIHKRVKRFFEAKTRSSYVTERKNLLFFCISQNVPPEAIVSYVMKNELESYYWVQSLTRDVHSSVYLAYKALLLGKSSEDID